MFTNRGTKVWPDGLPETFKTEHLYDFGGKPAYSLGQGE
jgi:hypothetical protein